MKSFNAGDYVFLNNPEHRMHQTPFKILSKVYSKRLEDFEYCIESRRVKLFVDAGSLYKVDEIQLAQVQRYLGGNNAQTH